MANFLTSTNMSLPIPVAGVDPGPDYALNVNAAFTLVDSHDHSAGKGVPVTPAGLNISSDLPFLSNNATQLRSVRFIAQGSPLALPSDLGCLYVSGVDLYFNDESGNQVRITQSGGVAGSPGSIANLTSPASATYVSANQTFVWQSAANTPANLDAGFIILRNNAASSKGLSLKPPSSMAADITMTLPSLPATQKIVTLDNSGNFGAAYDVDNSTLQVVSNIIGVKPLGIATAYLADQAVTPVKMGAQNTSGLSTSSGNFTTSSTTRIDVTNMSRTITTSASNRYIRIEFSPTFGQSGYIESTDANSSTQSIFIINRSGVEIFATQIFELGSGLVDVRTSPSILNFTDTTASASTLYTYKLVVVCNGVATVTNVHQVQMNVYEI